jgi:hypothetical protein
MKIFQPVLSRLEREQKIRRRLALMDQYRYLFTLPSQIASSTASGSYESAVHDFKKGSNLLQNELEPSVADKFSPIWSRVSLEMAALRAVLYGKLLDAENEGGDSMERLLLYSALT